MWWFRRPATDPTRWPTRYPISVTPSADNALRRHAPGTRVRRSVTSHLRRALPRSPPVTSLPIGRRRRRTPRRKKHAARGPLRPESRRRPCPRPRRRAGLSLPDPLIWDCQRVLYVLHVTALIVSLAANGLGIYFTAKAISHESRAKGYTLNVVRTYRNAIARLRRKKPVTTIYETAPGDGLSLDLVATVSRLPTEPASDSVEDRLTAIEANLKHTMDSMLDRQNQRLDEQRAMERKISESRREVLGRIVEAERQVAKVDSVALDLQLRAVLSVAIGAVFSIIAMLT